MCQGAVPEGVQPPPSTVEAVCASAPGKLILFGEHAVVYAQPAVAAALSDLRIHVLLEPRSRSNDDATIHICMPDLPTPIDCHVEAQTLLVRRGQLQAPPTPACASLLEQMLLDDPYFNAVDDDDDDDDTNNFTIHAILPVLYLLAQLGPSEIVQAGCKVTVRSQDLPVGAGLGSSAAFGVACAAALLQWKLRYSASGDGALAVKVTAPATPSKDLVEEINRYAYYSEILLHGRPSGIDNTVSAHGGAWRFQRTHHETTKEAIDWQQQQQQQQQSKRAQQLRILLVHTGVPRRTKQLVARVRHLYDQHPGIVTPMLQAMGAIATAFCETVAATSNNNNDDSTKNNKNNNSGGGDDDDDDTLLTLVRTNQRLLCALGVSHDSLDRVCAAVQRAGPRSAAAKLTGAGGGGCAMVLLRTPNRSSNNNNNGDDDDDDIDRMEQELIRAIRTSAAPDYHCSFFSSRVGGEGVLFVPPRDFPDHDSHKSCSATSGSKSIVKSMRLVLESSSLALSTWKLSFAVGATIMVATGISATLWSRRRN